ncbi:uncharacterized protein K489DRAFT_405807 [Dissoconium aciculare CBS 342.82]|uniref:Uncharacterized protein n=1 Tax=Dissoconium aciculare CBS 342.82 TaxID=1314786 RepID=A0A6J3MGR2_9PEZI|nr:uncharacterized protein K489DRAFT_405807 [Dissoconium aciculare CBS 342.82]KAF1827058.1 hypothetical protein K489DRAFT_405807 [Dissoconium aciculare CBS 342.82]
MRFSTSISCLLAYSASYALAFDSTNSTSEDPSPAQDVEPRQVTGVNLGLVQNPLQVPPVTTIFLPTSSGLSATWLPNIYTQTFPPVPEQWPSPVAGEIGYGTLTKGKRAAQITPPPTVLETGIAGRIRQ